MSHCGQFNNTHLQQGKAKIMQTPIKNNYLSKLNLNYLVQENYFI
jgi:hypothetical protein